MGIDSEKAMLSAFRNPPTAETESDDNTARQRLRVVYLLDGYSNGGAELGLATLVEHGFFAGQDLEVCAIVRDTGASYERLRARLGEDRVKFFFNAASLKSWHLSAAAVLLWKELRRYRPDILVISLPRSNLIGRAVSLFFPRLKVVTFEHNTRYRNRLGLLLKWTSPLVDVVLFDHPETWSHIRTAYYPRLGDGCGRYVPLIMLNPRELPEEDASERSYEEAGRSPARGPFRIISAGRLTKQKNYEELLRAVASLRDLGHDVTLSIVGDGELRESLQSLAQTLAISDRVSFPGFVERWTSQCQAFDAYVQCSLHEGLCISVLEAMSQGMVVLTTDVGGIRQYGRDRSNMLKIRDGSASAIVEAIQAAMVCKGPARRDLRRNAVQTVRSEFGPDVVRGHWREAIRFLQGHRVSA